MILAGDCIEQMRTLEADSVDAIVTDPPYGLEFMGKDWDGFGTPLGFQTWTEQWAREALRVLKPGGHLLAFGGTRMYHRLAAGVEDAGFEIRDTLMWLYGSGFPKSLDVSRTVDKKSGVEGEWVEHPSFANRNGNGKPGIFNQTNNKTGTRHQYEPTEAAKKWQGWGTALKPAVEPIVLARKPLIGTVAENVLTHGTGALNIDASRIEGVPPSVPQPQLRPNNLDNGHALGAGTGRSAQMSMATGRWPANILLDEEAAALLDEQSGVSKSPAPYYQQTKSKGMNAPETRGDVESSHHGDTGGASRFFYVAKASRSERNKGLEGFAATRRAVKTFGSIKQPQCNVCGSRSVDWEKTQSRNPSCGHNDFSYVEQTSEGKHPGNPERNIHPTVKPVQLMRYLIRLVTPKGGTVLDPFLGSGTTAVAAIEEGVAWIGCEREPEYLDIIKARVAAAQPGMGLTLD
jgi:site-specific DNA-methyltransferase (adenine-specific)